MKRLTGTLALLALFSACSGESEPGEAIGGGGSGGGAGAGQPGTSGKGGAVGTSGASMSGGVAGQSTQAGAGGGGSGGAASGGAAGSEAGNASGGAAGQGGASEEPAGASALEPIVKAFCATARACCASVEDVDLDDCETAFAAKNEPFASLSRGAVTLDESGLEACRAAYVAAATSCEMNGVLSACAGLVKGKLADGAACALGSECGATPGPNNCLITEQNGTIGVCKKTPHGRAGDPCSITCRKGEDCTFTTYGASDTVISLCFEDEGLFCDWDSEPAKCQPLLALGATCTRDDQCGSVAYCDSQDGKCKKRATLGEDCGYCLSSLSCVEGKCKSPPFSAGSTCQGYTLGPY